MGLCVINDKVRFYALKYIILYLLTFRADHDAKVPFMSYRIRKDLQRLDTCLGKHCGMSHYLMYPWEFFLFSQRHLGLDALCIRALGEKQVYLRSKKKKIRKYNDGK